MSNAMTSPISPSAMQKDKKYYIDTGNVVILVQNVLFRIHGYFFERESNFFRTLFETPPTKDEPAPGTSDSSAIILLDTTPAQFSRFLWVFYNPKFSIYDEASVYDWKSILVLSERWMFPEVKQLAIRELQKHDLKPVERIRLYHENSVDRNFLVPQYLELCQRNEPLSMNEGLDLGLETTLMIARTREEIRSPRSPDGVMSPLTPTIHGPALLELIGKSFVASKTNTNGPLSAVDPPQIIVSGTGQTPTAESNGDATPNGVNGSQVQNETEDKHKNGKNQNNQHNQQGQKNQKKNNKDSQKSGRSTPDTNNKGENTKKNTKDGASNGESGGDSGKGQNDKGGSSAVDSHKQNKPGQSKDGNTQQTPTATTTSAL